MRILKRLFYFLGPLGLIGILGVSTSGFPSQPFFSAVTNSGTYTSNNATNLGFLQNVSAPGVYTGISVNNNSNTNNAGALVDACVTSSSPCGLIQVQPAATVASFPPTQGFTGASVAIGTFSAVPVCFAQNVACRAVITSAGVFNVNNQAGSVGVGNSFVFEFATSATTPTNVVCIRCGANSVARTAAGRYTYTYTVGTAPQAVVCTVRNTGGAAPPIVVTISTGATSVEVDTYTLAGSLTDPASNTNIQCVGSL